MHNKKFLKAKLKSYNGKIITNFRSNELTRESSESIGLSVILIDSVFKSGSNYYRQLLFEESKFGIKKKRKRCVYTTDESEISSDSDEEDLPEKELREEESSKKE